MIYSVHGYYHKLNGRKMPSKIEAIVFAANRQMAEDMVRSLFAGYPAEIEFLNVAGAEDKTLQEIYSERPELVGIAPEQGYIYNLTSHNNSIQDYFK